MVCLRARGSGVSFCILRLSIRGVLEITTDRKIPAADRVATPVARGWMGVEYA